MNKVNRILNRQTSLSPGSRSGTERFGSQLSDQDRRRLWNILSAALMLALVFWRIQIGEQRPVEFVENKLFDDYTLLMSADFEQLYHGDPTFLSLIKTLSFPWFLNFAAGFPFSVNTVLALFWAADALLMYWLLRENKSRRLWALCGFAFTLFCPAAFENTIGVQLYRNILLAPATLLFMLLLAIAFTIAWQRRIQYWKIWICFGLMAAVFPFVFYIKEDGIWMLAVLAAFCLLIAAGLFYGIYAARKKKPKRLLAPTLLTVLSLCLPFVTWQQSTQRYIAANEEYFGLPYITLRTDSEFFHFIEMMYRLETPDRSLVYWSPKDTFRQAVEVSPTLQSMPAFTDTVLNNAWILQGDDITGDFMGWTMLIALEDLGLYESPQQVNALFKQINAEVEQAFKDGRLKKESGRIYLTSKSAGRTFDEVLELFPELALLYQSLIFLPGYEASYKPSETTAFINYQDQNELDELLRTWSKKLKTQLVLPKDVQEKQNWIDEHKAGAKMSNRIFDVYRVLMPVLFFGGAVLWALKLLSRVLLHVKFSRRDWVILWLIFLLMGVSVVYGIALVWFSQFIDYRAPADYVNDMMLKTLTYYGPGMLGMIYPAILLAPVLLMKAGKTKKAQRKNGELQTNEPAERNRQLAHSGQTGNRQAASDPVQAASVDPFSQRQERFERVMRAKASRHSDRMPPAEDRLVPGPTVAEMKEYT